MSPPSGSMSDDPLVAHLLSRCRFPGSGPLHCAVSGGPDSTALLVLASATGTSVVAHHVDHGLRPSAAGEGDEVAALARRLGADVRTYRAPVDPGPNLEARARDARRRVLPPRVLTGHTADDQAETVVMNLLRGAGLSGGRGIGSPERRPLLALRRSDTVGLCVRLGLATVDDEMNRDPAFTRNRIRHELLPLMSDVAARDVVPLLGRFAEACRDAEDIVARAAEGLDPTDARALRDAPEPLSRTAIRRWIMMATGAEHPVDRASVDRVLDVARGEVVATEIVGGHRVARSGGRLSITAPLGSETDG